MADFARISPLADVPLPGVPGFALAAAPVATRFLLRADPAVAAGLAEAFGCGLPARLRATQSGSRAVLWLGPDEWLLLAGETISLPAQGACSLVDVSHRQTGLRLAGPRAAYALNSGCPLDLAAFPVGMVVRTIFAKAEIVLWRTGAQEFHIDVWRSFAEYVARMLSEAARLSPEA